MRSIVFDLFHPVRVEKGSGKRWINLEPIKSSKNWLRGKRGCFPRLLMSRMLSRVNPWAAQRDLKVCGKGSLGLQCGKSSKEGVPQLLIRRQGRGVAVKGRWVFPASGFPHSFGECPQPGESRAKHLGR